MRPSFAMTCILLLFSVAAHGQYVGYEYKGVVPDSTLPNGVKHLGGALISDIDKDPVYGIAQVAKGRSRMLWLEVSTGQNEKGVTGWRVLDVLSFPSLRSTQHLLFASDPAVECVRSGKPIEGLVAIGTIQSRKGFFKPERVWFANIEKKKFIPASTLGLRCTYSEP